LSAWFGWLIISALGALHALNMSRTHTNNRIFFIFLIILLPKALTITAMIDEDVLATSETISRNASNR
jgi:hypothetical protein